MASFMCEVTVGEFVSFEENCWCSLCGNLAQQLFVITYVHLPAVDANTPANKDSNPNDCTKGAYHPFAFEPIHRKKHVQQSAAAIRYIFARQTKSHASVVDCSTSSVGAFNVHGLNDVGFPRSRFLDISLPLILASKMRQVSGFSPWNFQSRPL